MCKSASNGTWHIVSAYMLLIKIIVVVVHLSDHQQTFWLSQQSLWYSVSEELMGITGESMFLIQSLLELLLGPASRPRPFGTCSTEGTAQPAGLSIQKGPPHTHYPDHLAQDSNWQSGPTAKGGSALTNSATQAGLRLRLYGQGVLPQGPVLGGPRQPQWRG